MTDEVEQRLAKGSVEVVTGMVSGSPLKMGQGLLTMLGLETNASAMQRYVAAEYETFVTDTLQGLTGESGQHKRRLDTLEQRQLKMAWVVEEHERQLGEKGALRSDLVALLEAGFEVWKKNADARKRKLLGNALRNAFDPKQYEEGLTLRLFSILKDLEYGDIWALREVKAQGAFLQQGRIDVTGHANQQPPSKVPLGANWAGGKPLVSDHLKRLHSHGLIYKTSRATVEKSQSLDVNEPTELGERLLALTADPPPSAES